MAIERECGTAKKGDQGDDGDLLFCVDLIFTFLCCFVVPKCLMETGFGVQEEMSKGYFDDFRTFRESKGKVLVASKSLIPKRMAKNFPEMKVGQPETCSSVSCGSSGNCVAIIPWSNNVLYAFQ